MKLLTLGCGGVVAVGYVYYKYCLNSKMADEDKEQIQEPS